MVFLSEVGFPCNFISLLYAFHLWLNVIAFAIASEWIIGDSLLKVNMKTMLIHILLGKAI